MVDPLLTLADMLALLDLDPYIAMPKSRETFKRLKALRKEVTNENNEALLAAINSQQEKEEIVRVFAAGSIIPEQVTNSQLGLLEDYLLKDKSVSVRLAIIGRLRQVPLPKTIPLLIKALIRNHDPRLNGALVFAIRDATAIPNTQWADKVTILLKELNDHGLYREHLDMNSLVTAVLPEEKELKQNRYQLTDDLIPRARYQDSRMIDILAGLILQSCAGNINHAGERVEAYAKDNKQNKDTWDALRAEISGLLTPAELRASLNSTFQEPLEDVHQEIRSIWQSTIRDTRNGLRLRMVFSSLVSLGGLILLGTAVWLIIQEQDWKVGIVSAIIALIILALSFSYGGILKESRRILTDIGVANAVYVAYVQRMLSISHAYAQHYLQGYKPAYEQVRESNKLIDDVVQETVKALKEERPATLDDLINRISK